MFCMCVRVLVYVHYTIHTRTLTHVLYTLVTYSHTLTHTASRQEEKRHVTSSYDDVTCTYDDVTCLSSSWGGHTHMHTNVDIYDASLFSHSARERKRKNTAASAAAFLRSASSLASTPAWTLKTSEGHVWQGRGGVLYMTQSQHCLRPDAYWKQANGPTWNVLHVTSSHVHVTSSYANCQTWSVVHLGLSLRLDARHHLRLRCSLLSCVLLRLGLSSCIHMWMCVRK